MSARLAYPALILSLSSLVAQSTAAPLVPVNDPRLQLVARQLSPSQTPTSTSQSSPTSTSTSPTSSPTAVYGDGSTTGNLFADRSPALTAVTAAILVAIVCSIFVARFKFVRRHYQVTPRSYFIPANGIGFRGTPFFIRGAIPKPPTCPPPSYVESGLTASGRTRIRRGPVVQGPTIRAGGAREGRRDADDVWEGDEIGHQNEEEEEKDQLPSYHVDLDLPVYPDQAEGRAHRRAARAAAAAAAATAATAVVSEGEDRSTPSQTAESMEQAVESDVGESSPFRFASNAVGETEENALEMEEVLPSVQAYEAHTRATATESHTISQ